MVLWLSQQALHAAPPTGQNQLVNPSLFGAEIYATPPDPFNPDPFNFPIGTATTGEKGTTGSSQFVNESR